MPCPVHFQQAGPFLAACLAAAWSFGANAAPKTVCTITVNSPDEKETFQRHLPPGEYRFVELVERGRPDWLASACQQRVSCDALIISGHFDGGDEFYTDRLDASEYLSVEEMERASCSDSCPGVFSQLKEVYLFGCNTLKPEPRCTAPRRRSCAASFARATRRRTPYGYRDCWASVTAKAIATACGTSSRMCRCSTVFRRRRRSDARRGRCSIAISSRRPPARSGAGA